MSGPSESNCLLQLDIAQVPDMQAELRRCIATSQQILEDFGAFAASSSSLSLDAQAHAVITDVSLSGVPYVEDSRVPSSLNQRLHELSVQHFHKACMGLLETHGPTDLLSLRSLALQLRSTYTQLYERQVLRAASMQSKTSFSQKQPYANDILLYAFQQSPTPSRRERERLAALTGMSLEQVRVWFQNRRSRLKKKAVEVQPRAALQLPDLLERVVASSKAATLVAARAVDDNFEDDYDSGYCSGSEPRIPSRCCSQASSQRRCPPLSVFASTPRSYPAEYIPQPVIPVAQFEPPTWPRGPVLHSLSPATVTIDELARSMERLSLRHRRQQPQANAAPVVSHADDMNCRPAAPPARDATQSAQKQRRSKDAATGRRVAGSRRAASATSTTPHASNLPPEPMPWVHMPAVPTTTPCKAAKKSGPPRRKPTGKALSRQASAASLSSASTSSSDSSRSTSYASDFSSGSVASGASFTSVDSSSPTAAGSPVRQQMYSNDLFASCVQQPVPETEAQVPIYDFTNAVYDIVGAATGPLADAHAWLSDPDLQNLLARAQAEQMQPPPSIRAPLTDEVALLDQQPLDVGLASMDTLLDMGSAPFPTLEALLSDSVGTFSSLPPQLSHLDSLSAFAALPQKSFGWHDAQLLVA